MSVEIQPAFFFGRYVSGLSICFKEAENWHFTTSTVERQHLAQQSQRAVRSFKPNFMQRIFLFAATLLLVAHSAMAITTIGHNPLKGKKINQRMLESMSTNHRGAFMQGRMAATTANWFPDSARQSSWDAGLLAYTLQADVSYHYNNMNMLDTIRYFYDFGTGLQLVAMETMVWLAPNKLTQYHYQEDAGMGLEEAYRFEMLYDQYGNAQSRIHYVPSAGQTRHGRVSSWTAVFGDSLATTYNAQGVVTGFVFSILDMFGGTGWITLSRGSNISYAANGHPQQMTLEDYDAFGSGFVNPVLYSNMSWGFGFTTWSEAFGLTNPFIDDFAVLPQAELFLMQPTDYIATQGGTNLMRSVSTVQNGRIQQFTIDAWSGNSWQADQRFAVSYQGTRIAQFTEMLPNTTTAAWDSVNRNFFSYDAQGNLLENHEASYDASSGWVITDGVRYAYTFANGKPASVEAIFWDVNTSNFEKGRLIEYVFVPGSTNATPNNKMLELTAWPNPTEGDLKLRLGDKYRGEAVQARVMNLSGQTVMQEQRSAVETENEFDLSLHQLPAGMYLVKLSTERAQQTLRIVKR